MSLLAHVLAQAEPDSSSAPAVIFGVLLAIGLLSILALTKRGQRTLLPLLTVLIGGLIGATTIADATWSSLSVITLLGLGISLLLILGGLGALREGIILPDVTQPDDNSDDSGSHSPRDTP